MICNYKDLKEQLNKYFAKELSQKELGEWAEGIYVSLLRGGFLALEHLKIYPYIRKVAQFHIEPNNIKDEYPCSENDIHQIQKILLGIQKDTFTFPIEIRTECYPMFAASSFLSLSQQQMLTEIQTILHQSDVGIEKLNLCMKVIEVEVQQHSDQEETIVDLLQTYLLAVLQRVVGKAPMAGLYLKHHTTKADEIANAQRLLACALGESHVTVCVNYHRGFPALALLLDKA